MTYAPTEKAGTITLTFKAREALDHVGDPIHRDLSALAIEDRTLFGSCDELASVERLLYDPETESFRVHRASRSAISLSCRPAATAKWT